MSSPVREFLNNLFSAVGASHREKAVALTVLELRELENIFALLLLGSLVGLPAPPTFLSVELLPFLEEELAVLHERAKDADDMLAEMVGSFGVD